MNLALVPCKTMEENGQFQRVSNAATGSMSSGTNAAADAAADPSKQCAYFHKPVADGTGDQWCMMRDGLVIGRIYYAMNTATGNFEQTFTRLKKPVSIGILSAGGSLDRDGSVVLPANAEKAVMRKAAMEKCKPLIKDGDAHMTAFKACFKEATQ